jgi:hypothetical protein
VPVRGQINRAIAPEHVTLLSPLFTPVGLLAAERKFQHLAPTIRATTKPPAMAPKRANPKADEAAKAALLAARKGADLTEDGEVLGVSTEEQLGLISPL